MIKILSFFQFWIGLSAVVGGYGLVAKDGLGMPLTWLEKSPFTSYFWPGMILAVIVGGTHLVASVMLWRKAQYSMESLAVAAFGLQIWIFTEMYIIEQANILQIVYFAFTIISLLIVMYSLKYRR